MKFRKTTWFDTKTNKAVYGIKAQYTDGKYYNAMMDGKPLFFDKEEDRNNKIAELKLMFVD